MWQQLKVLIAKLGEFNSHEIQKLVSSRKLVFVNSFLKNEKFLAKINSFNVAGLVFWPVIQKINFAWRSLPNFTSNIKQI